MVQVHPPHKTTVRKTRRNREVTINGVRRGGKRIAKLNNAIEVLAAQSANCSRISILSLVWSHVDTDQVGNLSAPVCAPRAWHARAVAMAQAGGKLAVQFTGRLSIDSRVDDFVRDVLGRVGWIIG